MKKGPSPRRSPDLAAEPEPPTIDALMMELAVLRERDLQQREEIEALREDRARLSGRLDRIESSIETWRHQMYLAVAPPRVFREYAPGILEAVPAPPTPPAAPATRTRAEPPRKPLVAEWAKVLHRPAGRLLAELVKAAPKSLATAELAGAIDQTPDASHFRRGLAALRGRGLIDETAGRVALHREFWKLSPK